MINIEGLSKLAVISALYDESVYKLFNSTMFTQMLVSHDLNNIPLTDMQLAMASAILEVDLSSDIEFDESEYDVINGAGIAERAINRLRSDIAAHQQDTVIAEKLFHKSRIMYAIVGGVFMYVHNNEHSHKEWLEELNINDEVFEKTIRGYYKDNCMYFYIGSGMQSIESEDFLKDVQDAIVEIFKITKVPEIKVFNGMKIGKIGEVWEPLKFVTTAINPEML